MTTTLYPLPVRYPTLRTNLCTNGSFEYGIDGWAGFDGTAVSQLDASGLGFTQGLLGDFVLYADADGTGDYVDARQVGPFATVDIGRWVGIRAWVSTTSATPYVRVRARYNEAYDAGASPWEEVTDILAGTFVQSVGQVPPDLGVRLPLRVELRATADPAAPATTSTSRMYIDQVLVVVGDTQAEVEAALAAAYFDGDTTDTATRAYEWEDGPPGLAISTEGDATADPVGTVSPTLVLEPQHETQTNVTVHRPLAGGAPTAILRKPGLPEGTLRFLCADRATAQQLEETCDGSATVHIESTAIPNTPFEFAPHGAVRARQNVPFQSWTVDVPYVRLT